MAIEDYWTKDRFLEEGLNVIFEKLTNTFSESGNDAIDLLNVYYS